MRYARTKITCNESYEGQPIEVQCQIAESDKQPLETSVPMIYTDRKEGVIPDYNIRTDRWEVARQAMDAIGRSYQARRADYIKAREKDNSDQGPGHSADDKQSAPLNN